MAEDNQRVDYLAGFCCPVGGLAAGKPRVLCHESEIYLSNGSEFVYIYNQEGKLLNAVYRFPDQVWHLELLALRRELYVLCARNGIYCLSLDPQSRLMNQADGEDKEGDFPSSVFPVDSDSCVFPDATLCAFTVLNDIIITLAQGPSKWKMRLFEQPQGSDEDPRPGSQFSEVEFSTCILPSGSNGKPLASRFLPVLCCASPSGTSVPHIPWHSSGGFVLEEPLFGLLFGADAALLESPMILCGFPDGQLCCVPLKALLSPEVALGGPETPVKILHHLEEPVVFIGALRTEPRILEDMDEKPLNEDTSCDCMVAVGHYGKMMAVKSSQEEGGNLVPELREYYIRGPILCAACGVGSRMYYSTHSDLSVVDLACNSNPSDPEKIDNAQGVLPSVLTPASLSICSVVTLSVSSRAPKGEAELLALSAKGRLMTCSLDLGSEDSRPVRMNTGKVGQKIKELLSGIGNVSERVSFLKKAVDQRNRALTCLNEAMNVSCALLSNREGPKPISCTTTTAWSCFQLRDVLTATCLLENSSDYNLDQGWTFCIQVFTSSCALEVDSVGSAITYTIPVDQLTPGSKREVTLPLGSNENGKLDLPVTISCALFYSLKEILGSALTSSDSLDAPFFDECPPDILPDRDGIFLPLGEYTVDMLQCLRFPSLAVAEVQVPGLPSPTSDPVNTFLEASRGQVEPEHMKNIEPIGPDFLRAKYLPPSVASVKVSSELLKTALKEYCSEIPLCCATLQWLLAENSIVDIVKTQVLTEVQGVAPDGNDIHLLVREVAVTELCPAGPIQAVEIQMESPSLANMCRVHHAVIRRIQVMIMDQAAQGSNPPDLRVQYLRQIHANHEMLLKEVQALRDRLCVEDDASASAAAEKLLQVYKQLRNPSLILL
ncbi:Fanconi anemia core complex-associated protein 100 isoform X1 [Monodelphis domestica]|uniref:FA core complex associated protein 100 n=1 Tax=Monodelphis domestica TaxID=13616 RepID=F7CYZ5_MONDO|nr:Fanconi anemia core complex-associated protein 100 isoform X1 [Monodelphis domestica]